MATVVLIHSALGLTRHVQAWAEALRLDGHHLVVPDLFEGLTFDDLDSAVDHVDSEGMRHWVDVARATTAHVDGPRVYMGFSLGAAVSEVLALTEADAVGAVLVHGALAPSWFEIDHWPAQLTAQLHYSRQDPWGDAQEDAAFLALAGDACETFEYEVSGHLFAFEGWPEYDDYASHLLFERVGDYLATFD